MVIVMNKNNKDEYVFNGVYEEHKVTKVPKKFGDFFRLVIFWIAGTLGMFYVVYVLLEKFGLWV